MAYVQRKGVAIAYRACLLFQENSLDGEYRGAEIMPDKPRDELTFSFILPMAFYFDIAKKFDMGFLEHSTLSELSDLKFFENIDGLDGVDVEFFDMIKGFHKQFLDYEVPEYLAEIFMPMGKFVMWSFAISLDKIFILFQEFSDNMGDTVYFEAFKTMFEKIPIDYEFKCTCGNC